MQGLAPLTPALFKGQQYNLRRPVGRKYKFSKEDAFYLAVWCITWYMCLHLYSCPISPVALAEGLAGYLDWRHSLTRTLQELSSKDMVKVNVCRAFWCIWWSLAWPRAWGSYTSVCTGQWGLLRIWKVSQVSPALQLCRLFWSVQPWRLAGPSNCWLSSHWCRMCFLCSLAAHVLKI